MACACGSTFDPSSPHFVGDKSGQRILCCQGPCLFSLLNSSQLPPPQWWSPASGEPRVIGFVWDWHLQSQRQPSRWRCFLSPAMRGGGSSSPCLTSTDTATQDLLRLPGSPCADNSLLHFVILHYKCPLAFSKGVTCLSVSCCHHCPGTMLKGRRGKRVL